MKSIMIGIGLIVTGLIVAIGLLRKESPTENAMNSLIVIVPYKYEGLWVFDDAAVGLSKEPFIAGTSFGLAGARFGFAHSFSCRLADR